MNLSQSQSEALELFYNFLSDTTATDFVLEGGSGKGKTFLAKQMIKTVEDYDNFVTTLDEKHQGKSLLLCATTNQAAERLSASTNKEVTTIHSLLGLVVKNNTHTGETNLVRPNNRTFSIIKHTIVFIDEASMIDDQLENFIQDSFDYSSCKIVRIGDPDQILAVNATEPVGLQINTQYRAILREYQRADASNPITLLGEAFRQSIFTGVMPKVEAASTITLLTGSELKQVIPTLFKTPDQSHTQAKMLAYKNDSVIQYNQHIRKLFYPDDILHPGEIVMTNGIVMTKNLQSVLFSNNAYLRVVSSEIRKDTILNQEYEILAVTVTLVGYYEREVVYTFRNPNQLQTLLKQLYARRAYQDYFEIKSRYCDLRPVHAMTTDKSQGSTFDDVVLDLRDLITCRDYSSFARRAYVAVTRARNHLYIRT